MGNRTKITNITMDDVTKDELIQYFFVPEGCGGAFRIPANKDAFLAWVENKRNGTLLEAGQTAQDAAMKSLNEYVKLVKKANDESDIVKKLRIFDEANAAYKRYERFMAQADSVNDKLSKNIMSLVDQS